jgi:hypothetical protein
VSNALQSLKVDRGSQLPFISAPPRETGISRCPHAHDSRSIKLIRDAWERGLNDNRAFRVLMGRIKKLLDESAEAGADEQHAHGEHGRFDSHWQEGAENLQIRQVDSEDIALDGSSTTWPEGSDANSMAYSEYTVRSITSFNERTNWLFRPHNMNSHWQEGADNPQIRFNLEDIELDDSSTTWPEGSDASSMAYSEYTVRSITSFNERTSWLVRPRNELRK